ncbi:MAG TPA: tripartite tricarboxylate transporter substrate binding protein [Burkholderiales bacterium]|jgi:tripartite-type tricarboxylate transporter receptor subunit TctC
MIRALFAALAVAAAFIPAAHAQQYPAQPVKLIVPFPVGGGADIAARVVAQHMGTELGQTVFVENYGGAGGTIGTSRAAQAAPDGYTLFVGTPSTHGTNPAVYSKLPYDPIRDFTPIGLIGTSPFLLIAHPSVKAQSAKELIALARAHPGELNYASFGNGSINHLGLELFNSLAKIDAKHVPYRGGAPALADLIAGRVQYTFDGSAALPAIRAGQVKLLAVGSAQRWHVFGDTPTVSEAALPGFELTTWYGLFAPARTPQAVIDLMNAKLNAALAVPQAKESFAKMGFDPAGGASDVLVRKVRDEVAKWTEIARQKNIHITD